jgi:cell division protein FtsB
MAASAVRAPAARRPQRPGAKQPAWRGPAGIRWDRVARVSLLVVLVVVVLSYLGPATKYLQAWRLAGETRAQVQTLRADNERLTKEATHLQQRATIETEARRLGLARPGEQVDVVRGLPRKR